jgi:hypothetical protein
MSNKLKKFNSFEEMKKDAKPSSNGKVKNEEQVINFIEELKKGIIKNK